MKTKAITAIMIILFLASILSMAFNVALVKAQVTWTLVANDENTEWDSMGERMVPMTIEKGFDGTLAYIRVSPYYASTIFGHSMYPPYEQIQFSFDLDQVNFRVDMDNSNTWTTGDLIIDQDETGWSDPDPLPPGVTITWDAALTTATLSFPASWTNLGVAGIEVVGIDEGSVNWYPDVAWPYHPDTWDPATYADVTFYNPFEDLKNEIASVPNTHFKPPASDRKTALCDKIDEVVAKIDAGDYMGAIMKLKEDIKPKLDGTKPPSWLTFLHPELVAKIDGMISDLQTLI